MTEPAPSPSTQRFRNHAIHAALTQWIEKLTAEKPEGYGDLAAQPRDAYVRLRWVLRDLKSRLDATNPMLAPPAALDAINSQLAQLQPQWEQYRAAPAEQWQPLNSATDALVNEMRGLPPSTGAGAWQESFEELRDEMNKAIADAQASVKVVQGKAADTETKLKAASDQLDALTAEIQIQKTRLDQMLTQHTEAFTKAQQDRDSIFTEAQSERRTQFEAIVTEFKSTTTELVDAQKEKMDGVVAEATKDAIALREQISDQLDKAVEIVGTIVKTTMSGNYQIIANREYRNAWVMRGTAIASFLLMGGMVIWAVWSMNFNDSGMDWGVFAFRLSLGFAFLIPGIYCASESRRHWSAEKHNRRISLELAALDPFLVKLDEAKQKEIIAKKADVYFGGESAHDESDDFLARKHIHLRGDQLFKLIEQIARIVRGH